MRSTTSLLGLVCLLATPLLVGCGDDQSDSGGVAGDGGGSGEGDASGVGPSGSATGTSAAGGPTPGQGGSGVLTAGEWDDNLNFERFLAYRADVAPLVGDIATLGVEDRVVIRVTDEEGAPVARARVEVREEGETRVQLPTDGLGEALLFPAHDGLGSGARTIVVTAPDGTSVDVLAPGGTRWDIVMPGSASRPAAVDIAFVLDETGSMGDEIAYLKTEIDGIAAAITAAHPEVSLRWALVGYRDHGDAYVVESGSFTDDLGAFRAELESRQADGGGDTPEAMHEGLAAARRLDWRDGNVARLAFLVADAPTHEGQEATTFAAEVDGARRDGIKIVPVASSGVDGQAELQLRIAAQATLGRYVFLTDDSGVGGAHAEPTIPCYVVTHLDELLVRTVASELDGERLAPAASEVIRTVGAPDDEGVCHLDDGSTAQLY